MTSLNSATQVKLLQYNLDLVTVKSSPSNYYYFFIEWDGATCTNDRTTLIKNNNSDFKVLKHVKTFNIYIF